MLKDDFTPSKGVFCEGNFLSVWELRLCSSGTPQGSGFGMKWANKELRTEFVKSQIFAGMQ